MNSNIKSLFLRDLCAKLPYGVKVHYDIPEEDWGDDDDNVGDDVLTGYSDGVFSISCCDTVDIEYIKPYLRPLSSITEEEKKEFMELTDCEEMTEDGFGYLEGGTLEDYISNISFYLCEVVLEWLDRKMFDFRKNEKGETLIEAGLALKAPEGMYEFQTNKNVYFLS